MLIIFCLTLIVSASCLESRIIGGISTTIDKYPYQVSLHYNGKLICGGSIISKQWILTAAHCVYGMNLSLFKVRVASSYHDEGGILITNISSIIPHEWYDEDTYDYDVALIKLITPLSLGRNAKIIILATPPINIKTGSKAIVSGWGKTSTNGESSKVLQTLTIPIIDQEVCQKIFARYRIVTANMLCAGDTTGGKDTCHGDSGGPLVYNNVQIGIVSWGAQCASPGYPGVYTRISTIRSWITKRANV
ncbi:Trypsin-4 [Camponotus floridanus]|uniref:Trypsin-4 n=1 Tax=Camponotus floridanus TaxID=104421 RepID=E1ZYQ4_CAMFO|nr:trypsin-4 [Camponotus floridanus]EFN73594.1 Trypsin-4 [Camponotus floridanus]